MPVYVVFSRSWCTIIGGFNEYYLDVAFSEAEVVKLTGYLLREMRQEFLGKNKIYFNDDFKVIERKPYMVENV